MLIQYLKWRSVCFISESNYSFIKTNCNALPKYIKTSHGYIWLIFSYNCCDPSLSPLNYRSIVTYAILERSNMFLWLSNYLVQSNYNLNHGTTLSPQNRLINTKERVIIYWSVLVGSKDEVFLSVWGVDYCGEHQNLWIEGNEILFKKYLEIF